MIKFFFFKDISDDYSDQDGASEDDHEPQELRNFEMNFETTRTDLSSPIFEPHSNNNVQEGLSYEAPNETPEMELEMNHAEEMEETASFTPCDTLCFERPKKLIGYSTS